MSFDDWLRVRGTDLCVFTEREGANRGKQEAGAKSGQQIEDNRQAETSQP